MDGLCPLTASQRGPCRYRASSHDGRLLSERRLHIERNAARKFGSGGGEGRHIEVTIIVTQKFECHDGFFPPKIGIIITRYDPISAEVLVYCYGMIVRMRYCT